MPQSHHFVTEIKRSAVDRSMGLVVGIFAVLAGFDLGLVVVITVMSSDGSQAVFLPLIVPLVFLVVTGASFCYAWGATRSIEWPLILTDGGLVYCTPRGRLEVPWEAVTDLRIERKAFTQQLTVSLHPQAGPGAPGVVSTLAPGAWRVIRRSGLRLSLRVIQQSPAEVAAAVAASSRGRWQPAVTS